MGSVGLGPDWRGGSPVGEWVAVLVLGGFPEVRSGIQASGRTTRPHPPSLERYLVRTSTYLKVPYLIICT